MGIARSFLKIAWISSLLGLMSAMFVSCCQFWATVQTETINALFNLNNLKNVLKSNKIIKFLYWNIYFLGWIFTLLSLKLFCKSAAKFLQMLICKCKQTTRLIFVVSGHCSWQFWWWSPHMVQSSDKSKFNSLNKTFTKELAGRSLLLERKTLLFTQN